MELSGIRSVRDANLAGRTAFVRVDFNVPIIDGEITDDARIRAALPTIQGLREQGARVVLASHLGRPDGQRVEKLSMITPGVRLAELLDAEIVVPDECVGDAVRKHIKDAPEGGVVLLENLRFHTAETKGDRVFASELASLADVYVNDAFGTAHRAHASTYTMVQYFAETARFAGNLISDELRYLNPLLQGAEEPYVAIVGGAKVSDKLAVLENLVGRLDTLLIGGAMAYTFLASTGVETGMSLVEHEMLEQARALLASAQSRGTKVILPVDHVVADSISSVSSDTTSGESIPVGLAGFDIGPKTIARFCSVIDDAATIFWNGPLGVFESPTFNRGTFAIAERLADCGATVIVGGGDSAAALRETGRQDDVTHVSTGGGASLEFIEGRELPGIAALRAGHRFK